MVIVRIPLQSCLEYFNFKRLLFMFAFISFGVLLVYLNEVIKKTISYKC